MATLSLGKTYKQKVLLLLVGSLLFAILAWYLSFSKTYIEYKKMRQATAQIQASGQLNQEIQQLEKQLAAFKKDSLAQSFSQERLYELVTDWCQKNNLAIEAMPQAEIVEQEGYRIFTNELRLKGAFIQLVELMYALERTYKIGQLVYGHFSLVKNRETKRIELIANLHLKNIESISKK